MFMKYIAILLIARILIRAIITAFLRLSCECNEQI